LKDVSDETAVGEYVDQLNKSQKWIYLKYFVFFLSI